MNLPPAYKWLETEPGPRILLEMLKMYGTVETPGPGNNPTIMAWAKSIGLEKVYKSDATAWCGLGMAYAAGQAGWDNAPMGNALWARNWASWGNPVAQGAEMLGDVLVFLRGTGGHVGEYIGEDDTHFHVLGCNQSDAVNIRRKEKSLLIAARRCPWRIKQPANVRKIYLSATGVLSENEA
jgi:uncharacterized protein (TIGR02594 family)